MLCCMYGFVLSVLEGIDQGYFFGSFDITADEVSGPCVGLGVGGIMNASDIYDMQLNDSSTFPCKAYMYSLLGS